jgi:DNA-binding MurR/RpiR family transcriptional regulator
MITLDQERLDADFVRPRSSGHSTNGIRENDVTSSSLRTSSGPFPAAPGAFLSVLRAHRTQLTRSEQKIADFLLHDTGQAIRLSISELADRAGVGEATVTRFCQRLGLRGFQELKLVAAQETVAGALMAIELPGDGHLSDMTRDITRRSMQLLADTARLLDPGLLEQATGMVVEAARIDCYGTGLSGLTAREAQLGFMRVGKTCNAHADADAQMMSASLLTPDDVAIAFSHSGNARDVALALQRARERGARTMAVTSQPASQVARAADLVLPVAPGETPYASSINSKIAHMFVLDLLVEACAQGMEAERPPREQVS